MQPEVQSFKIILQRHQLLAASCDTKQTDPLDDEDQPQLVPRASTTQSSTEALALASLLSVTGSTGSHQHPTGEAPATVILPCLLQHVALSNGLGTQGKQQATCSNPQ